MSFTTLEIDYDQFVHLLVCLEVGPIYSLQEVTFWSKAKVWGLFLSKWRGRVSLVCIQINIIEYEVMIDIWKIRFFNA
jgi:hypothetical protein